MNFFGSAIQSFEVGEHIISLVSFSVVIDTEIEVSLFQREDIFLKLSVDIFADLISLQL